MPTPATSAPPAIEPVVGAAEHEEFNRLEAAISGFIAADAPAQSAFDQLALEVHHYQRRSNPLYAKFCGTFPEPSCWQEIPALPQSAFKQARIATFPVSDTRAIFRTSGTTGETRGEHHFRHTRLYDQAILAGWDRLPIPRRLPLLILTPRPDEAPHSSLSHMMGVLDVHRSLPRALWLIAPDGSLHMEKFLAAMERILDQSRPIGILGTALAFLALFERLGSSSFPLPSGSFAMETGGFKGVHREISKTDLYAMFTQHLGLPSEHVWNEYGMTELSSQFYAHGLHLHHTGGPWVRALVIDPETGREAAVGSPGVIRIIDLANLGSSIAIETQDLAIRQTDGFLLLGRSPAALPRGCSRAADETLAPR